MDLKGFEALPELDGSLTAALGSYMSSSGLCFFFPQILQATNARAPMRTLPPMPTTTPMMILLCEGVTPELPELLSLPLTLGASVALLLLEGALLVMTREMVLLPLTVMMVVRMAGASVVPSAAVLVDTTTAVVGSV